MAAVQPRVAPRRHPPTAAVPPLPTAPSQAPAARPQLLPCKRSRAGADAVAVAHGRKERVAESCCPSSSRLDQLELVVLVDDDSGEEDDGCGSCVDGAGAAGGQTDDEEESGTGSRGVAWWSQDNGGGGRRRCSLWANGSRATEVGQLRAGGERDEEDPMVAAARRQEEDRKFWEACLASGYP